MRWSSATSHSPCTSARRYFSADERDDLEQVASLGLLKAIDRFDPARGIAFTSFAVPTIVGELKRYFRDLGWSVRVPRSLKELAARVNSVVRHLTRELGRPPTVAEIAAALRDRRASWSWRRAR